MDINEILLEGINRGASDIHITCFLPPILRINGKLIRMDNYEKFTLSSLKRSWNLIFLIQFRGKAGSGVIIITRGEL